MPRANDSEKTGTPVNTELIQVVSKPPELPLEGTNSNLSNFLGQNSLIKDASNKSTFSFLKANDGTTTNIDRIADGQLFLVRVDAVNVPTEHIPMLIGRHGEYGSFGSLV